MNNYRKCTMLAFFLAGFLASMAAEMLSNPKLSGGDGARLPDGWKVQYWSGLETRFDVAGKAGWVEMKYIAGGARFGVKTEVAGDALKAKALDFSAEFICQEGGKCGLLVECLDAGERVLAERTSAHMDNAAWAKASVSFNVPPKTARIICHVLNVGSGSVRVRAASLNETAALPEEFPIKYVCSPAEGNKIIYGQSELNTFIDSPVGLAFDFWGDRFKAKNLRLVIEVPEPLSIVEAFSSHTNMHGTETPSIEPFIRDGMKWNRYSYCKTRAFSIIGKTQMWKRQIILAFAAQSTGEHSIYYYLCDDQSQDKVRKAVVRVLPPLESLPNPKNFLYIPWDNDDICFPSKELWPALAKRFEECNMNSRPRNSSPIMFEQDKFLEARGWKMFVTEQDYLHVRPMSTLVEKFGNVPNVILADGTTNKGRICPEFFIQNDDFIKQLAAVFAEKLPKMGVKDGDWLIMDFEPWGTMDWCFCPVCRAECGKWFLDGHTPTTQEARTKYRQAWIKYRVKQAAAVNRRFVNMVKSVMPGMRFYDYDYPIDFTAKDLVGVFSSCAKDPRTYEDCVDGHFSSFYHHNWKKAFDLTDINVKTLKRDVFIMPSISRNDPMQGSYTTTEETISPRQLRQKLLAGATAGCKGIGIYPGSMVDGKFFIDINKAMAEVAFGEDFFQKGKRQEDAWKVSPRPNRVIKTDDEDIDLPSWNMFCAWRAHGMPDGRRLVSLFNYNREMPMYADVTPQGWTPQKGWILVDPIAKKRIDTKDGAGCLVKVEPEDVKFLHWTPSTAEMASWPISVAMSTLADENMAMVAKLSPPALPSVRIGNSKAGISDVQKDGIPDVTVSTPSQEVVISTLGGALQRWTINGKLVSGNGKFPQYTGLLWDYLLVPLYHYNLTGAPYTLTSIAVEGDAFAVSFAFDVESCGINITKKYIVSTKVPSVRVEYALLNNSGKDQDVSFWSHNFPDMPVKSSCNEMAIGFKDGIALPDHLSEQIYTYKDNSIIKFAKSISKVQTSEFSCWLKAKPQMKITFQAAPESINQFYFWMSDLYTAEFMTRKVQVPNGKGFKTWINLSATAE